MSTLRRLYLLHANFIPIIAMFVAFRVLALILYKPGGYISGWNDYYFFRDWAVLTNQGLYPYLDFWMEHPPLFPWLVVAAYKLSLFAPVWHESLLWFSLTFGLILLPFEAGNLILIYAIVSATVDRSAALLAAWLYSALYLPVFFWSAGFDCYPLFFLLLSIYFAIKTRSRLAGIATGLGFMVKIVPAVAAPVILIALAAQSKAKAFWYCLVAGVAVVAISLPFLIANPVMFGASFRNMLSRSSWETVWALLDGYYGSGRGVASPSTRFDPATATITHHGSSLPWVWITLAFGVLLIFILTRKIDWQQPRKVAALSALALNLFILYSKGYSPQFVVYPLAFIIILFPNWRGIVYSLLLSAINVAEYPFALIFFDEIDWMVAGTVVLRTALIVVLSYEYLAIVFGGRLAKAAKFVLPATASVVLLALVGFSVGEAKHYYEWSLGSSMFRESIEFLRNQPRATLIFTDNGAYEEFFPYLRGRHNLLVTDGSHNLDKDRLKGNIWLVYVGSKQDKDKSPLAAKWLAENAFPVDSILVSNARLGRYSPATLKRQPSGTAFGNLARLVDSGADELATAGDVLHVSLTWQVLEKTDRSFKVFLHLVDAQGRVVAQQDLEPSAGLRPTQTWTRGEEIVDNHGIPLSNQLSPGTYRLRVGLYDSAAGTRVANTAGGDEHDLGAITIRQGAERSTPLAKGQ